MPAALLCAGVVAGCGSSSGTLDTASVEQAIASTIYAQRHVHVTVSCPSDVSRKAGVRFQCLAKLEVGVYPVEVTVTNEQGHVVYSNQAPLVAINTPQVERAIATSILQQRHARAQVSCPAEVLQQASLRFDCSAQFSGRPHSFVVVELDGHGHVRYQELTARA